jgi:hypothetical protein
LPPFSDREDKLKDAIGSAFGKDKASELVEVVRRVAVETGIPREQLLQRMHAEALRVGPTFAAANFAAAAAAFKRTSPVQSFFFLLDRTR